jgi:hypothetical protein
LAVGLLRITVLARQNGILARNSINDHGRIEKESKKREFDKFAFFPDFISHALILYINGIADRRNWHIKLIYIVEILQ